MEVVMLNPWSVNIELPSMPIILSRIIEITHNPDMSAQDLANAVMTDQSLTSRMLRLANSAYFHRMQKVETVTDAILTLGFGYVRNLAASASLLEAMFPRRVFPGFDWQAMWLHSVTCAIASEEIFSHVAGFDRRKDETVFIAGLLHDIGKLALACTLPLRFMAVVEGCRKRKEDMLIVETDFLSTNHAEVGQYVTEQWGFPEKLVQAIACHHTPECAAQYSDLARAVCAADMLAKRISAPCIPELTAEISLRDIAEMAKINPGNMSYIIEHVKQDLERSSEIISWGKNLPNAYGY